VPYCGYDVIAAQPFGALQVTVDHTALVHVSVVEPAATP